MICPSCGTEFEDGMFCPECGTKCKQEIEDVNDQIENENIIQENKSAEIEQERIEQKWKLAEAEKEREIESARQKTEQERLARERAENEAEALKLKREESVRQAEKKAAEVEGQERERRESNYRKKEKRNNKFALWSLILGISSYPLALTIYFPFLTVPLSIIFGIIALVNNCQKKAKALIGVILSTLYFALSVCVVGIVTIFVIFLYQEGDKWNKQFDDYIVSGNYTAAREMLDKEELSLSRVDLYIRLGDASLDYQPLVDALDKMYSTSDDVSDLSNEYYEKALAVTGLTEDQRILLQAQLKAIMDAKENNAIEKTDESAPPEPNSNEDSEQITDSVTEGETSGWDESELISADDTTQVEAPREDQSIEEQLQKEQNAEKNDEEETDEYEEYYEYEEYDEYEEYVPENNTYEVYIGMEYQKEAILTYGDKMTLEVDGKEIGTIKVGEYNTYVVFLEEGDHKIMANGPGLRNSNTVDFEVGEHSAFEFNLVSGSIKGYTLTLIESF